MTDPVRSYRRYVTAKTDFGIVQVEVYVKSTKVALTAKEQGQIVDSIADSAMKAINEAPYVTAPISRIKVR